MESEGRPPPPPPDIASHSAAVPGDGAFLAALDAAASGDKAAFEHLLGVVYDELRAIARYRMSQERAGHTLQATALVNEVYVRLLGKENARFEGRKHFFRAAAEAMRKVLIDHARLKNADKRGGGRAALTISNVADLSEAEDPAGILALDEMILRLQRVDAQAAEVVRLRFYGGLDEVAVGEALGISERTVRRDWAFARGWLRDALEREAGKE